MCQRLVGKIAVVTGAASGLGAAIASAYAHEGATVVAADLHPHDSSSEPPEDASTCHRVDVRDSRQVEDLMTGVVERFGRIDIAVNNAGVHSAPGPSVDVDPGAWRDVVDTNLNGVWYGCRAAIRVMLAQPPPGGCLINMSSRLGMSGAGEGRAGYCATKGAVSNLTRQLAVEYGRRGIRVNAICPGFIADTGLAVTRDESRIALAHEQTPYVRIGRSEDVAAMAVFLASAQADFVNGQNLLVDGGASVRG